jgi:hypothetical protein
MSQIVPRQEAFLQAGEKLPSQLLELWAMSVNSGARIMCFGWIPEEFEILLPDHLRRSSEPACSSTPFTWNPARFSRRCRSDDVVVNNTWPWSQEGMYFLGSI